MEYSWRNDLGRLISEKTIFEMDPYKLNITRADLMRKTALGSYQMQTPSDGKKFIVF